MNILVIEDDRKTAGAIREGLSAEGYEVEVAFSGEDGFFLLHERHFDLVVMDLMLPGRDGLEVLATLRRQGDRIPVLILTARERVEDRVEGLDLGADDYLVKPFAFAELSARIRALIRRGRPEPSARFQVADLELDAVSRRVERGGRAIELTQKEFDLLAYLARAQGRTVSREMLARDVWQATFRATTIDNVIDVHIARLRRKIDDPFPVKLLHTVRGVGFVLSEVAP